MVQWLIRGMVFLGSLLMVYNIYSFVRFARYVKKLDSWNANDRILYMRYLKWKSLNVQTVRQKWKLQSQSLRVLKR